MPRLLRADDVRDVTFSRTTFREVYDESEVDDLLDDIVATLRRYEEGGPAGAFHMESGGLSTVRLTVTRLRRGYDRGEVDAFLADVVHTLRHHESGGALPSPQDAGTASDAEAPPGAVVERESWRARLLRTLRGEQG